MKSELGSKMNYASQFEAAEPEPMVTVSLVAGLTTPRPPRCAGDMPRCLQHCRAAVVPTSVSCSSILQQGVQRPGNSRDTRHPARPAEKSDILKLQRN